MFIIYILVLKISELQDWVDGSVRALAKAWGPEFKSPGTSKCVCNPRTRALERETGGSQEVSGQSVYPKQQASDSMRDPASRE